MVPVRGKLPCGRARLPTKFLQPLALRRFGRFRERRGHDDLVWREVPDERGLWRHFRRDVLAGGHPRAPMSVSDGSDVDDLSEGGEFDDLGVLSILRVGLDNSQLSVFPLTLWGLKESDLPTIFHGLRRGHPWVRTSATFEARQVRRLGSLDRSSEPVVNFSNLEFCPDVWALWTSGDSRPSRISPFSSSRTRSTSCSRGSSRTRGGFNAVRILKFFETPGKKDAASPVS